MNSQSIQVLSGESLLKGDIWFPETDGPASAVVLCHGFPPDQPLTAGDPGYAPLARYLASLGLVVLTYKARGVGDSEGDFSMLGWVEDCVAAIDYLGSSPHVDPSRIGLAGFSAGGGVALEAAVRSRTVRAVAVIGTPARFRTLERFGVDPAPLIDRFRSNGMIRNPSFPPSVEEWLSGYRLVVAETAIAQVAPRPVLIVQGGKDQTVNPSDATTLYEAAQNPRELYYIGDGEHILRNDIRLRDVLGAWLCRSVGNAAWS